MPGCGLRAQDPDRRSERPAMAVGQTFRQLKYTLFLGQELLKFGQFAQCSEIRLLLELVLLLEALLQALAKVLQRQIVAAAFGVQLGEVEVILRALLNAPLLEDDT